MKKKIDIPVVAIGPGTQPVDDDGIEMVPPPVPGEMNIYRMPDLSILADFGSLTAAFAVLRDTESLLRRYRIAKPARRQNLDHLNTNDRELVDQVLGNGEVSIVHAGDVRIQIQESVLAGVWRVQQIEHDGRIIDDAIEVADIPEVVLENTFTTASAIRVAPTVLPHSVMNAPALITEIGDKVAQYRRGDDPHVINLSLLPLTDEDLAYINDLLGVGPVTILSRGYGNCRITSTATPWVWWVQYFNSDDVNILNTIEISDVPAVACAAQEDIDDSAERLSDIMAAYA